MGRLRQLQFKNLFESSNEMLKFWGVALMCLIESIFSCFLSVNDRIPGFATCCVNRIYYVVRCTITLRGEKQKCNERVKIFIIIKLSHTNNKEAPDRYWLRSDAYPTSREPNLQHVDLLFLASTSRLSEWTSLSML